VVVEALDADLALRALAHGGRRQMVSLVWERERSSGEVARRCRLSHPATSQHLKLLREVGLVEVRADGNQRLYRARPERLAQVRALLDQFWGSKLAALRAAVEGGDDDDRGSDGRG
jgi:DNA-binding transcriptional ArsR family regulator